MVTTAQDSFAKLNIMAGTARAYEQGELTEEERRLWDRDFDLICTDLEGLVDAQLGADLRDEKDFYTSSCQVAKGYFNDIPFGGLKCSTGQFGFRLLSPQDFKTTATSETPAFYSWVQTVTTSSGHSYATAALGYNGGDMYCQNVASKAAVISFHRLLSYKPSPRLIYVEFSVNGYPYVPYSVHPFSKVDKIGKLFKVIPMPARICLHPGGRMYATLYFDTETGATAPSGTTDLDIEIGPFGLVFGEYDYLASAAIT